MEDHFFSLSLLLFTTFGQGQANPNSANALNFRDAIRGGLGMVRVNHLLLWNWLRFTCKGVDLLYISGTPSGADWEWSGLITLLLWNWLRFTCKGVDLLYISGTPSGADWEWSGLITLLLWNWLRFTCKGVDLLYMGRCGLMSPLKDGILSCYNYLILYVSQVEWKSEVWSLDHTSHIRTLQIFQGLIYQAMSTPPGIEPSPLVWKARI